MIFQHELLKSLHLNSDRIAIESGNDKITYAGVLAAANNISAFLLNRNIGKESLVGVMMDDRSLLIRTAIGVMNAGCVFVPIDGSLPPYRLKRILDDLQLEHIITDRSTEIAGGAASLQKYIAEDILGSTTSTITYPVYDGDDSIYVYFTSGTTGKPKGIVGKNKSLLQFLQWEIQEFSLDHNFRYSQLINPCFDAFLREVFVPLLTGGTICISPGGKDFFTVDKMTQWLEVSDIHVVHCVPSIFRIINHQALSVNDFAALRYILMSGERIIPAELINWYNTVGDRVGLVNLYGPTETTMVRCCYRISPADVHQSRIPIGYPISGTEILISDDGIMPCNPLIPGELYILSDYTAKGYLNEPALTHEKFVRVERPGKKPVIAFRTGDTARVLPNGKIDLLGRNDRQIKLRGIRVEIDEIEQEIIRYPGVKNVLVTSRQGEGGNDVLWAFVIMDDIPAAAGLREKQLQQYLAERLPEYMIPANIFIRSSFPLLESGKADLKKMLAEIQQSPVVAPADETEVRLLRIWETILGRSDISVEDIFHKSGGNSLSSLRLVTMIYKEFGVVVSLLELFNHLTIRKQASLIRKATQQDYMNIPQAAAKDRYQVASAQARMFYLHAMNKAGTAYNMPMAWVMKEQPDLIKIKATVSALVNRHESLRTIFCYEDGQIFQVVKEAATVDIEVINCEDHHVDAAITRFIRPFDLEQGPLFRCAVISTTAQRYLLVIDMHHIICDGISQQTLYTEFRELEKGIHPAHPAIRYKDYAEWEFAFRKSPEYLSHREFWLNRFDMPPPELKLPVVITGSGAINSGGGEIDFQISKTLLSPFLSALQDEGITAFSALFTVYLMYLCRITGQDDIIIGVPASGRLQHELEGVVGMFVKTLPVRCHVKSDLPFVVFAGELHALLVEANSRQVYDLADLLQEINARREQPVTHLFKTMFVFQNFEENSPASGESPFVPYVFNKGTAKYPVALMVNEGIDHYDFQFEYATSYFTAADITTIVHDFKKLVSDVMVDIHAKTGAVIAQYTGPGMEEEDISFNL
nr:amino acid adenylation domain-containing protein [uncultured Chitinophaga sp.]